MPLTPDNRGWLKAVLQGLRPGGSTDLSGGWFNGIEQITSCENRRNFINQAWLFTDGLANRGLTDPEALTTRAGEFRWQEILTSTFGVGLDTYEAMLNAVTEKGVGNFHYIKNAGSILQTFSGELEERLSTVGRDLALQIDVPKGVECTNLNDYEMSFSPGRYIIRLADIFAGEEKMVVIRLKTPAGEAGQVLQPEAILMYTDLYNRAGHEIRPEEAMQLTYDTPEEARGQRMDIESTLIIGRLLVEEARHEILAYNFRRDYSMIEGIITGLRQLLEQFHMLNNSEILQLLEEIDRDGRIAQATLDPRKRKEMHYQAYLRQKNKRDYNIPQPDMYFILRLGPTAWAVLRNVVLGTNYKFL